MRIHTLCYLALDAIEGTTTDKQDVVRIDMDVLLVRMLTTSLRRHIHNSTFQQFQQALLYALTTDITRNRRVVSLTGYLIYLIYEDNTTLSSLHLIVGHLQQACQDALYILSDITCLSEYGSIDNGERDIEHLGDGAGQQGFASTRRTHHDDI